MARRAPLPVRSLSVQGPVEAALRADLLAWFDRSQRDLPWRRTRDPYAIWVSEVMLQQTQVATVIPYWERFLARFPTLPALAAAPLPEVLALWRGLGYYARARNLHRAAGAVVEAHGGKLPGSVDALAALPGFGRYTVGAVASIAFGLEAPLVDGNVARVFSRLFLIEGASGDRVREVQLWERAEAMVQGPRTGDLNQALMELGALICRTESPTCLLCPLREGCGALRAGRVDELPVPKVRAPRKPLVLAAAVWRRGDLLLLARRPGRGLFGGLWELPCVEVQPGGPDGKAALAEALGEGVEIAPRVTTVKRTLTHRDLVVELYPARGEGQARVHGYEELRWSSEEEAGQLGMSTAMVRALAAARATTADE